MAAAVARTPSYPVNTNWYIDSGATDHITNKLEQLSTRECYRGTDQVQVPNGTGLSVTLHAGESSIAISNSFPIHLNSILHVPHISKNLLSVHKLCVDNNIFLEFHSHCFYIKDNAMQRILHQGKGRNGLYNLAGSSSSFKISSFHFY